MRTDHVRPASLLALAFLAALVTAAGCAPDAEQDDVDEADLDETGGKVDGPALAAIHAVADYRAVREGFFTTAALTGLTGGRVEADRAVVAIRRLTFDGQDAVVVVDGHDLSGLVVSSAELAAHTRIATDEELSRTPYVTGLAGNASHAFEALASSAVDPSHTRFALTVDMCQSSKPWERTFFEGLIDLGHSIGAPLSVGVAMTGRWANVHPAELARLVAWNTHGDLRITWIDHSYNHQVKDAHGHLSFLTDPTIDLTREVMRLEVLLIAQGLRISPWFRFPGLVHNSTRLAEINQLSLFAVDSNAWLAKGEPVVDGGVVLVHGNGNEHLGIQMWNDELTTWRARLIAGTAEIVPVSQVVTPLP